LTIENKQLPFQGMSDHDALQLEPQFAANVRNVRSLRERIIRAPGGRQLAPPPLPGTAAGVGMQTGTFTANTTTGAQTITHTLGATPCALILYSAGTQAAGTFTNNPRWAMGMTDGTTSRATCNSVNRNNPAATARRYANAIITFVNGGATLVAEASFTSFSSSNFVINWTTADGTARVINYMIFGNTALSAKVVEWTFGAGTGAQSVTGVGFLPQLAVHLTTALAAPGTSTGSQFCYGAMSNAGGQVTNSVASRNGTGSHQCGTSSSISQTIECINSTVTGFEFSAQYTSMDSDGFTVNRTTAPGTGKLVATLCMNGFTNIFVGRTATSPAVPIPGDANVTGPGFLPSGLFSVGPGGNPGSVYDAINVQSSDIGFGAVDGVNQNSIATTEGGATAGSSANQAQGILRSNVFRIGADINFYDTLAYWKAFTSTGWTMNIQIQNGPVKTVGFHAVAFSVPGNQNLIGIPRNYPEVYVDPSGPALQRYVLLTHKSAYIYVPSTPSTGLFTPTAEAYTGSVYQRFSIANTQGIAAWSQGKDNIREWDGTNFSALITSGQDHAAPALIAFADRIVSIRPFFGGVDHPTQIRWCIDGNVNDWNGTGSGTLEIIETSQDPLVTGFVLADRAFLAKRREIIELLFTGTLSPVFGTVPRIRGMGVLAPYSVALGEQLAFWLGPDDVYMFDGSTLTAVGERMYNTITSFIDYQNLDTIQGAVYTPDSQYHLVVPPYKFVYDYRRDIWDWDDVYDFQAIGTYNVGDGNNFTGDIDKSEFVVVGDSSAQTTRVDFTAMDWLGAPIDSYFETKDYTADDIGRQAGQMGRFSVSLWDLNSLREVRFQGPPGNIVEVGISLDRGATWELWPVTINQFGVGAAWFQRAFSIVRFRFRDFGTDSYEIRGQWGFDVEQAGYNIA
jgi:hypothetical protein